jgi:hypothetical protein
MIFRMKTAIPIITTAKITNIFFFIGSLLRDYSGISKNRDHNNIVKGKLFLA